MRARAERELDLQMALGPALFATKAFSHPDVGRTYARASQLCEQLDDYSRGFTALRGLMLHNLNLLEMEKARKRSVKSASRRSAAGPIIGTWRTIQIRCPPRA
jgi:hypothetical protein